MKTSMLLIPLIALSLSTTPLTAGPIVFQAFLDGLSESPPNASPGTGFATVTIDDVAHTMRVQASFGGLIGTVTVAHIHVINGPGDADTTDTLGPVATTTPTFPGFPLGVTSGAYDQTFDMTLDASYRPGWITDSGGATADAESALFLGIGEGRAYLNIHTSFLGGGEIRGFLEPIPEPGTTALLAAGLAVLILLRKKSTTQTMSCRLTVGTKARRRGGVC